MATSKKAARRKPQGGGPSAVQSANKRGRERSTPRPASEANARGLPFRSKLLPYLEQIRKWRHQGKTYAEIAGIFRTQFQLSVHPDTINSFVLVRARGRKVATLPDEAPLAPALAVRPEASAPAVSSAKSVRRKPTPTPEALDVYPPADPESL